MNENNELLCHIYETAEMGVRSTTDLLKNLEGKDNKLKKAIEDELKEYEKVLKEVKKELKSHKVPLPKISMMTKMSSCMGIKMEVRKDNSDSAIAEMLIQGLTMGSIEMEKKINQYKEETSKSILKLAEELLEFQKNSIKKLKEYL